MVIDLDYFLPGCDGYKQVFQKLAQVYASVREIADKYTDERDGKA
jgi:hypothetical protein